MSNELQTDLSTYLRLRALAKLLVKDKMKPDAKIIRSITIDVGRSRIE
jgi:hypothetical protein